MNRRQSSAATAPKIGFTLLELFFVIIVLAVLLGMLLPSVQRVSHGAARRTICQNNLRQLGLALANYQSVHLHFPAAMGTGSLDDNTPQNDSGRLSGLVTLLPTIDQQSLWEQISNPATIDGVAYPAMGPAPWTKAYTPWQTQIATFRCPESPQPDTGFGQTNYAFCIGDMARNIHHPTQLRGAFGCKLNSNYSDVKDGSSNTIAMTEIGNSEHRHVPAHYAINQPASTLDDPSQCLKLRDSMHPKKYDSKIDLAVPGRGGCWADGAAGNSLINTILPPNSPSCAIDGTQAVDGIYSAGSFHSGGIQVLMLDGSVRFVSNDIDAGDPTIATLTSEQLADKNPIASPYGVWGALGTSAGEDEIGEDW